MTYREKLKLEYPEKVNRRYIGGCKGCPRDYGYEGEYNLPDCSLENCKECWDREIPGSEALSCSEIPNSSDLISRQAAIDGKMCVQQSNGVEIYDVYAVPVEYLKQLPSAQPEIVRCGECARRRVMCDGRHRCVVFNVIVDSDGYCKWAERRTDD